MCCLGFLGLACGYASNELWNVSSPIGLIQFPAGLNNRHSILASQLIKTNDDGSLCEASREADLKGLFATIDIDVTFIN